MSFLKKNLFKSLLIAIFVIPQVALAAWWNPFSWFSGWTLRKTENTQTEIMEKRIQELERKLNEATASVKIEATTTARFQEKKQELQLQEAFKSNDSVSSSVKSDQAVVKQIKKEENFSSVAASALLSRVKSYQDLADFIDGTIAYIDISIDELETLIAQHKGYVRALGVTKSSISQAFIEDYTSDIRRSNEFKENLLGYKETCDLNAEIYRKMALEKASVFVSRLESISVMEKVQEDKGYDFVAKMASKTFDDYKTYRKTRDNYYVSVNAELSALYSQIESQPSVSSNYKPKQIPEVELPKYTLPQYTNCTISGDGVGLQAYITCSTRN